jgi:hypothetical protein
VNPFPTTDVALTWDSSPDEFPISPDFRIYKNVAGGSDKYYYVLASDNYQVRVQYPSTSGATAGVCPSSFFFFFFCFPSVFSTGFTS